MTQTTIKQGGHGPKPSQQPIARPAETRRHLNAEHLLRDFAEKNGFRTPADIFRVEHGKEHGLFVLQARRRDEILGAYVDEAVREGHSAGQIAQAILKWSYPAKLESHTDVSRDQAAGIYMFASTSKVDWREMFSSGAAIVEDGKLLNGTFGRATTNHLDKSDVEAAALYLTEHDMHSSLPQAPFMLFGGRCRNWQEFEAERQNVAADREEFERELGTLIVEPHRFKVPDRHHGTTIKFRLVCAVWNEEDGRLYVVSDRTEKPTPFLEWVGENIRDLLSSSDRTLREMESYANESGLAKKLASPKSHSGAYRPWQALLEEVESRNGVLESERASRKGDLYKQAVKIWRFAMLQLQLESVQTYEERWQAKRMVESILNGAVMDLVCDDGRQYGNVKVLGGIVSKDEFQKLFAEGNDRMETLRFVPHYGCGFLTGAKKIHDTVERLRRTVLAEEDKFERERMFGFFCDRMRLIIERRGPVADELTLRDYLPAHLAGELDSIRGEHENGGNESDNRRFVRDLKAIFSDEGELLRSIVRRGIDTGVLSLDKTTNFVHMPSAALTYKKLDICFGQDYRQKFSERQINALVTEQVARTAHDNYVKWAKEMPAGREFAIEFFMENFVTGQATAVPKRPLHPDDFLDTGRKDYYLSALFTPEEVAALGLKNRLEWNLPA